MKRLFLLSILGIFLLGACSDDKIGPSIIDTSPPELNEIDQYIRTNYTEPYNIEVIYRYKESLGDLYYNLVPPKRELVVPLLEVIRRAWIEPYLQLGGDYFFKTYVPHQIYLSGSPGVNNDGTIVQGTAEGGVKIVLYQVNDFSKSNQEMFQRYFHIMHHEFAHILHQTKAYPAGYKKISEEITKNGKYTAVWFNFSDKEANERGFITNYAMNSPDEDFVEMIAVMLTHTRKDWDDLINAVPVPGRTALRKKEEEVSNYFEKIWKINLYELQELISLKIEEITNEE